MLAIALVIASSLVTTSGSAGASVVTASVPPAGWSVLHTSTDNPFLSVSCPTADRCIAVGDSGPTGMSASIGSTSDGGSTWIPESAPADAPGLTSVSCGSPTQCVAVGSVEGPDAGTAAILFTRDGGESWLETIPSGVLSLASVSCASGSHCVAVGDQLVGSSTSGVILATTDGGRTWKEQAATTQLPQLIGVSCPTTKHCVGAGGSLGSSNMPAPIVTVDGGRTWSIESQPSNAGTFSSVSCGSDSTCVAVSDNIGASSPAIASHDGGVSWSEVAAPGSAAGIDCLSATDCVAVGQNADEPTGLAFVTRDGGISWSSQSMPLGVTDLFNVSCSSESACISVGYSDDVVYANPDVDLVLGSTTTFSGLVSTTVSPSASPTITTAGEPTVLRATVAPVADKGAATGTVTFTTGAVTLCTARIRAGSGSCRASNAPLGINTVIASYSGDPTYFPAYATLSLSVSSVSCAHARGSVNNDTAGFTLSLSGCTPASRENRRATFTGSILTQSGSIVWIPSGQTTVGSLQTISSTAGLCRKGTSEYDVSGTETSGTSTYTHIGDAVTIDVCVDWTTDRVTMVNGTVATI